MDVIIVHYHAAAMVAEAVAALRSCDLTLNILVADNGSTPSARALLQSLAVEYLDVGRNAGYAGGLNFAFARTKSDSIVVMNEDVLVLPGCLESLYTALGSGAAVAGPEFFWNRDRTFRLPCTEERTPEYEVLKIVDPDRARKRWREHARRHWRSSDPLPSTSLSGALLAFRRDAWNAVGPMDEGFELYFEENDWLLRVARAGLRPMYVPAAKAIHLHDPFGESVEKKRKWESSFERFGNRYYGRQFMQQLLSVSPVAPRWPASNDRDETSLPLWIELTPSPLGFPAAASSDVNARIPLMRGPLYVQIVDDAGQELAQRESLAV
jgi:GT2 family glycosyltransferase